MALSSKEIIKQRKDEFYKDIAKQVKDKESEFKDNRIDDKSNNFLIVNSEKGLKIGPTFTNLEYNNAINMDYKSIVRDLTLTMNPYTYDSRNQRILSTIKDLSLSTNKVDLIVDTEYKPKFYEHHDDLIWLTGFSAKATNIKVESNPKIPAQIDHIIDDKLSTNDAIKEIYSYGFDNYYITKVISAGNLGLDAKRMLPTRQAITATDDLIGKILLSNIREFEEGKRYLLFQNEFLHNKFIICIMPGKYEYEQFEIWDIGEKYEFNHESERFEGRTKYAESQAGGYYSARLSILEYLKVKKIQAKVSVFRIINKEYFVPVGVWQVRENVKAALEKIPLEFNSKEELISNLESNKVIKSLNLIRASKIIYQKRLFEF